MKLLIPVLFLVALGVVAPARAGALDAVPLEQAGEQLSYRISYSGVFTAFAWKDLADMELYAFTERETFNSAPTCRATMTVDTRNYSIAELAYPVRLRYDALAAPDLAATFLVSDHDEGHENIHNVMWFDWGQQRIRMYRKRLRLPVGGGQIAQDFSWQPGSEFRWEEDGKEPLPAFLAEFPPVGEGLSYLIHRRTKRRVVEPAAMDPLTMLYALRTYDYRAEPQREIAIVHKLKVGHYIARLVGPKKLSFAGQVRDVLHVRVRQRDAQDGEAGQLDVWLTDDSQRTILRFDIEAPVGQIRVDLVKPGRGRPLAGCVDSSRLSWAGR